MARTSRIDGAGSRRAQRQCGKHQELLRSELGVAHGSAGISGIRGAGRGRLAPLVAERGRCGARLSAGAGEVSGGVGVKRKRNRGGRWAADVWGRAVSDSGWMKR